MNLEELSARTEIHDVLLRYCRGLDRPDARYLSALSSRRLSNCLRGSRQHVTRPGDPDRQPQRGLSMNAEKTITRGELDE